jgi:hypothetical protein
MPLTFSEQVVGKLGNESNWGKMVLPLPASIISINIRMEQEHHDQAV